MYEVGYHYGATNTCTSHAYLLFECWLVNVDWNKRTSGSKHLGLVARTCVAFSFFKQKTALSTDDPIKTMKARK